MSEPKVVLPMRRLATMWLQLFRSNNADWCSCSSGACCLIGDGGWEIVWGDQGWQGN